jgi:hypothetical protein
MRTSPNAMNGDCETPIRDRVARFVETCPRGSGYVVAKREAIEGVNRKHVLRAIVEHRANEIDRLRPVRR